MKTENTSTSKRGGARPNSGRKKTNPSTTKRIPLAVIDKLKEREFKDPIINNWIDKL